LLDENDVIVQIVSYIGKELFAKRPTVVAVFVLTLAPWPWQQYVESEQSSFELAKVH
jgi:hypothetical protein